MEAGWAVAAWAWKSLSSFDALGVTVLVVGAAATLRLPPTAPDGAPATPAGSADATAWLLTVAPRRWLWENVLVMAAVAGCVASALADVRSRAVDAVPTAVLALALAVALSWSALVARAAGTYPLLPSQLPRTALPKFRRPRHVTFRMMLQARMAPVRWWWVGAAVLAVARLAWFGRPAWHAHWLVMQPLCGRAAASAQPDSLLSRSCAVWVAWLQAGDAAGTPLPPPPSFALFLASAAAFATVVALGAVASVSACAWRARDFSGMMTHAESSWVWDVGTVGVHPAQELPAPFPRVTAPPAMRDLAERQIAGASSSSTGGALVQSSSLTHSVVTPQEAGAVPRRYPDSATLLPPTSLRVVILSIGTRGDVQPFIALALCLREAGHDVTIATTDDFKSFITGYGIHFASTNTPRINQPQSWLSVHSVADMIRVSAPDLVDPYPTVAQGFSTAVSQPRMCDVIIGTAMTITFALNLSEAYGIPCWIAKLAPDIISRAFTGPGWTVSRVGWLNVVKCYGYWLDVARATQQIGVQAVEDRFRATVGLGPVQASSRVRDMMYTPQLLGFSGALFPKPTDYPDHAFQAGFWYTSEAEDFHGRAPPRLRAFLEATDRGHGHRVAVVTFGSMILAARAHLLADIVTELLAARFHVLILTGWSDHPVGVPTPEEDPRVLCWKEAPHDWIFHRAQLVVHHGGAGTTGRALASGIPSIVIPVLRWADQMQWGRMVEAAGVGAIVTEANPSREAVRRAIHHVQRGSRERAPYSGTLAGDRANALGCVVRAEMSCESALLAIESCLCNLILPPHLADAIHPLAGPPPGSGLTVEQQMCVRHCVPCRLLRSRLGSAPIAPVSGDRIRALTPGVAAAQPSPRAAAVPPRRLVFPLPDASPASTPGPLADEPSDAPRSAPPPASRPGRRAPRTRPVSPPPASPSTADEEEDTDSGDDTGTDDTGSGGGAEDVVEVVLGGRRAVAVRQPARPAHASSIAADRRRRSTSPLRAVAATGGGAEGTRRRSIRVAGGR